MSVKKFRFVSPGVFINEIDNSQLPASPAGIGPLVIGRARSGPGLRPTQAPASSVNRESSAPIQASNAADPCLQYAE